MSKRKSIAKKIIIEELEEQSHPVRVEDVIFWALEHYAEKSKGDNDAPLGEIIAFAIKERILKEESKLSNN